MYRNLTLLTILSAALMVVSCKKSNDSGNSGGLVGNWNFLYLKASTTVTVSSGGVTSVTKGSYTTTNNSGTAKFTSDSLSLNALAYTASTTATAYVYNGQILIDSVSAPYTFTLSPTSEAASYKAVGSDSLYFPGGGIVPGGGSGCRYSIVGDTLHIAVNGSQTVQGGALETVNGTFYFLRQ
ncbi:MAG TPA: hypothetical protein VNU70_06540 [Puia sp.]|jgi:hypothetical protein|nr:hypothetical protein [Puia sp.]